MTRSDPINELATALAIAQGAIAGAVKGSKNPHFGNRYADLAAIWDACRIPLSVNGLAVVQFPRLAHLGEDQWIVELETVLLHASGQWMADTLAVPLAKLDAQAIGSALTYARRYALGAVAGVAPDEDDGEGAVGRGESPMAQLRATAKALAPAPPVGDVVTVRGKVLGITSRAAGSGTRWIVTLANAKTYGTLVKALAEVAEAAQAAGAEVEIRHKITKFGNDIVTLRDLSEPEPPI